MATTNPKGIVISEEILRLFKDEARIVNKKDWIGLFALKAKYIKELQLKFPELMSEKIAMHYDFSIGYSGTTAKSDFAKFSHTLPEEKVQKYKLIQGIPVPWRLLQKAGLDYKKFNMLLTPKQIG